MAKVTLEHVCKSFDKTAILTDISLSIEDREFVVMVGPSGCGKSTVLRLIAGLETLTSGHINIGDRIVDDVPAKDRDIAMVFQNYALYPHMTVYDNMAFGLKMRKVPKEDIEVRVRDAAKILDLEHLLTRKPRQLSGGQRQRVALGRAIVRDPKVFLMDEPLSNLDAKLRVQMRTEIAKLHKRLNATTIYVTHDQVEAMTMGDRIVILNKGVIQQVDTPMQIYREPANLFVAGFIGQMNFLKGTVNGKGFRIETREGPVDLTLPDALSSAARSRDGKPVILGIRPEHFCVPECATDTTNTAHIQVDLVEALGSETLVHFILGGHTVTAKVPTDLGVAHCDKLLLGFDLNYAHLFDADTEQRLDPEKTAAAV